MKAPKSKKEHYELYLRGVYGNRPLAWRNGKEMWESGYRGLCTIRGKVSMSGVSKRQYGVPASKARHSEGFVNETMPDDKLLIQGEIMEDHAGLCLHVSQEKGMSNQQAMAKTDWTNERRGVIAHQILRYYMDDLSFENVFRLLDLFSGEITQSSAVIEFSTFSIPVGDLGWNTVFWEVRNY